MKHELIKTDNYLLVVDDSEIIVGDWVMLIDKSGIAKVTEFRKGHIKAISLEKVELAVGYYQLKEYKKIIAHLPLNNSPILQGVDLLPPLEQEDDVEKLAKSAFTHPDFGKYKIGSIAYYNGYKEGYNKAKEKYKYTEEDMRKAFIEGTNHGAAYQSCIENEDWETIKEMDENDDDTIKEIIQYLSQPKMPVGFECETEWINSYGSPTVQYDAQELNPKTTTNSQGQTVWVGKYIY